MCGRVSFVFGLCFISARSNFLKLLFIWVIFHIHARFISAVDFLKVYLTFTFAFFNAMRTSYEWQYSTSWEATRYRTIEGPCWFHTTWSVVLLRLWEPAFRVLFFSFFFWFLFSKLILFTSYLLRIVVAEILFEIVWFFSVCYTRITTFYEWRRRILFHYFFFFTLKRTLGYYYWNDQNTTKTIKSR